MDLICAETKEKRWKYQQGIGYFKKLKDCNSWNFEKSMNELNTRWNTAEDTVKFGQKKKFRVYRDKRMEKNQKVIKHQEELTLM